MHATLVFPHQLYADHPALQKSCPVYLVEDELYFTQYTFHQQKLILHRASMKYYADYLTQQGYTIHYLEISSTPSLQRVFEIMKNSGTTEVHYADTSDYLLQRRLTRFSNQTGIVLVKHRTPNFLLSKEEFLQAQPDPEKYFMANFYIQQRKRFSILVNEAGQPTGGQWSFDADNRKKAPKNLVFPTPYQPAENAYVREAKQYVKKFFSTNYGSGNSFSYPVTHAEALQVLEDFLTNRMHLFGDYEDAIVQQERVLFHSLLTPALNIGLLSPQQILNTTLKFHAEQPIPLNCLEGFIRQIIGWREFMRGVYETSGVYQRKRNFYDYNRKIPESFWTGTTGIVPVDVTIQKILATGYAHHIERLMVLGNFMHLCGFDPDEVYRWFMEMFIDSYDWVMVPNVYGMSQYADGGLMTTKPYVSGSNYILKMSDYKKGEWSTIWDGLYWRYIHTHVESFKDNPRMSMMVNLLTKMDSTKRTQHLSTANEFLERLHS